MQSDQITSGATLAVLPDEFSIRIEFLSDWHVGSGLGRPGDLDRLVIRDEEGLPFLPAKTLTGILRDAAERVAIGLDDGRADSERGWYAWVRYVFGDQPNLAAVEGRDEDLLRSGPTAGMEADLVDAAPREAALAIRPGRLPARLRECLMGPGRQPLRDALVVTKPGVTIARQTKSAMRKHLRMEEMVRGGLVVEARAGWDRARLPDPASRAAATALLVAAARLAERLGGKRRRGSGRVRITVPQGPSTPHVADWLDEHTSAPKLPEAPTTSATLNCDLSGSHAAGNNATAGDPWVVLPLRVTLRTPVLIGGRTVGNVVEGLDFIPGTYFLALLQRVLGDHVPDMAAAIQSGRVRIAPATIELDGQRGLPVPAALHYPKVGGGFYNGFDQADGTQAGGVANRFRDRLPEKDNRYVKDYRRGYVGPLPRNARLPQYRQPKLVLRMHNTIRDDIQRPHEDVGGVYTYEAIPAGTVLRTELRVRRSLQLDEETLRGCFQQLPYSIGRSKKDDYGSVRVSAVEASQPDWLEKPRVLDDPKRLLVWLVSDMLLRDVSLSAGSTVDALRVELQRRLDCKLKIREEDGHRRVFVRANRLESWQTRWNLPRPSLICLAAGSCAEFEVIDGESISDKDLLALQEEGLGERRAEGYGMLCINAPLLNMRLLELAPAVKPEHEDAGNRFLSDGQEGFELAQQLELAAWRQQLERTASERALDERFRARRLGLDREAKKPTSSQAAVVRNGIRRLRGPQDVDGLLLWLEHLAKLRANRWPAKTLHCARDERDRNPVAAGHLVDLLKKPDEVWRLLDAGEWPVLTAGGQQRLRQELWAEAVRDVLDAALRAHQHALEQHERGDRTNGARD